MKIKPFEDFSSITLIPSDMLDEAMKRCDPNEFKVVCAIARFTSGENKEFAEVSISQIMDITGIDSEAIALRAINQAINNGYIVQQPYSISYLYALKNRHKDAIS